MKNVVTGLLLLSISALVACAAGNRPPAVGVWDVTLTPPQDTVIGVLTLNADGSGEMSSNIEVIPLSDVIYEGNSVFFPVKIAEGTIDMKFTGTADGDNLTGNFESSFFSMGLTGTRQ